MIVTRFSVQIRDTQKIQCFLFVGKSEEINIEAFTNYLSKHGYIIDDRSVIYTSEEAMVSEQALRTPCGTSAYYVGGKL